ncbi:hypothetical protein ACJMK2_002358 [Sinanodonta woodiana]|uniref:Kringle domain-containing protein n=1 Tax=Sinanodonta woodiana TaxID=1069815 RepID=A0ABD3XV36_SINWO
MNIRNILVYICSLVFTITSVGATEVLSRTEARTNLAKRFVKILEAEIQTCVTIASTSCKKELMVSQLGVVKETLHEFEVELTDCFINSQEYTGKRNTTISGRVCQHWNSSIPHEHAHYNFPDDSVDDAANYCRDPVGSGTLWCLTMDPNKRSEDCSVPHCGSL